MDRIMYDIVVVGAGPAGLCAAIYARRAGKTVLILDKAAFGGQITYSPKIENYPGFESISGTELADKMVEQVLAQGADVELECVTEVSDNGETKTVFTEDGNAYECTAVILALGARHRHLGLENEDRFIGEGISFCAVCDGAFYEGRDVILVGGGNSALQEAILLSETSRKVYVIQNLDFLTGEVKLQEILSARDNVEIITGAVVSAINDTAEFTGVKIRFTADGSERDINADGMFVAIGLVPENGPFENVCDLDSAGYIDADESCATKTAGVFVAGDCRRKAIRQVSTAIADGSVAAISACRYIDSL